MARIPLSFAAPCLLSLALCGCEKRGSETAAPDESDEHAAWDYEKHGPEQWGDKCATGEMQSPIDLPERIVEGPEHLEIRYQADALRIVDNGHTVQVNHQGASELVVDGVPFELVQYHFHSPSEHAEQGQRHSLELHLVHTDAAGNYAVIGVFLQAAEGENPAHELLWKHLPADQEDMGEQVFVGEEVDPASFLPAERAHYRYHGSLTTPPCTETVTWIVMDEPLQVTSAHIDAFRKLYEANARPLQMRPDWCLDVVPMSSPVAPVSQP